MTAVRSSNDVVESARCPGMWLRRAPTSLCPKTKYWATMRLGGIDSITSSDVESKLFSSGLYAGFGYGMGVVLCAVVRSSLFQTGRRLGDALTISSVTLVMS